MRLAAAYLSEYEPRRDNGMTLMLRGDHGSGKTHALRYLARVIATGTLKPDHRVDSPIQLFAKADDGDFLSVYRSLLGRIDISLFQEVTDQMFRVLVGQQLGKDVDNSKDGLDERERLRNNPEEVRRWIDQYLVDTDVIRDRQSKEFLGIPRRGEFRTAISYFVLDPRFRKDTFDWFQGKEISEDAMAQLGLSGPIDTPQVAAAALTFLARLCRIAGRPLLIYIDQAEKLILDIDGSPFEDNIGPLRMLAELLPQQDAVLLVGCSNRGWTALPEDVQQRFRNDIVFYVLETEEASKLVFIYLTQGSEEPPEVVDESLIAPFRKDGIRRILQMAGGNIRRFLQICHTAFEVARNEGEQLPIDAQLVDRAEERSGEYYGRESVVREVERIANTRGLNVLRNYEVAGAHLDLAITASDGRRLLLVRVSHALFYNDEAEEALESLNLIEELRSKATTTPVVLVAAGYVSPEIVHQIRSVVHELLIFDDDVFSSRFAALLGKLQENSDPEAPDQDEWAKDLIEELRTSLSQITAERSIDVQNLASTIAIALKGNVGGADVAPARSVQLLWVDERKRIEESMSNERAKQKAREWEELGDLRASAIKERWARIAVVFTGVLILVIMGAFSLVRSQINNVQHFAALDREAFEEEHVSQLVGEPGLLAGDLFSSQIDESRWKALQSYSGESFERFVLGELFGGDRISTWTDLTSLGETVRSELSTHCSISGLWDLMSQTAGFNNTINREVNAWVRTNCPTARRAIVEVLGDSDLASSLADEETAALSQIDRESAEQISTIYTVAAFQGAFSVIFVALAAIAWGLDLNRPRIRKLKQEKKTLAQLDQTSRMSPANDPRTNLLGNHHPYVRYAAVDHANPGDLWKAIQNEPSALIRRAIAKRLGRVKGDSPWKSKTELEMLSQKVPEVAYLMEGLAARGKLIEQDILEFPSQLRTLAYFSGTNSQDPHSLSPVAKLALMQRTGQPIDSESSLLLDAFLGRVDFKELEAMAAELEAGELREAIRQLSQNETEGLGRFAHLENISLLDSMYLFFNQMLYFRDRSQI